jgi:hypothetical protein
MNTTAYHKDVYLPSELEGRVLRILSGLGGRFVLTKHARERVEEKRIRLPNRIPVPRVEVVEVTRNADGSIFKFLIRFCAGDGRYDVCMSLSPMGRVPTCWLNEKNDKHRTLKKEQYALS